MNFRGGLRGKELVNTVGKVMLQGGGSFGTFLAIGSGLRCWFVSVLCIILIDWLNFSYV